MPWRIFLPALSVEQIPAGTGLLEGGDNQGEALALCPCVGQVDLQPDVHLHVVLLAVDPVGEGGEGEGEAGDPLLPLGGDGGLHLPAVLPALVGGEEEDVSTKLEVVSTTPSPLRPTQAHLLDEDGEAVQGGGQEQLKVAAEHRPAVKVKVKVKLFQSESDLSEMRCWPRQVMTYYQSKGLLIND